MFAYYQEVRYIAVSIFYINDITIYNYISSENQVILK